MNIIQMAKKSIERGESVGLPPEKCSILIKEEHCARSIIQSGINPRTLLQGGYVFNAADFVDAPRAEERLFRPGFYVSNEDMIRLLQGEMLNLDLPMKQINSRYYFRSQMRSGFWTFTAKVDTWCYFRRD